MSHLLDIFSRKRQETPIKTIIVDNRELNSLVPIELRKRGFRIEFKQLPVADYLINNIAIERKTIADFKASIISKRIIDQLQELKQYPQHLIIIEGNDSEMYGGNLHENAVRGMLLTIAIEFQVPIIHTVSEKDTAKYLAVLASKKQKVEQPIRASKVFLTDKEQIQFILEGFPGIGPASVKKLIEKFKSLKNIANASKEDLQKIIGKKSEIFYKIINRINQDVKQTTNQRQ